MTPDDTSLPTIIAPPLSPAGSFDAEVAERHEVEWLAALPAARKD